MAHTVPPQFETEPSLASDPCAKYRSNAGFGTTAFPSLPEAHRTIPISSTASWLRKIFAFAGPGYLVAVGYMDPGNWATDIAGGARFGYALLSVILLANLMAMVLQALSARLAIATGRDLAQASHDFLPRKLALALWVMAEIAIVATGVAEVVGSAIALNLLFGLPIAICAAVTVGDVALVV